jgi:phosphatidylinositol alpha-1,6-mannosyltransferase
MATVRAPRRVALVTSGLGTAFGGIGVVARMMRDAMAARAAVSVWRHHHTWRRPLRIGALAARASLAALRRPDFVMYDHVDLATLHVVLPSLRGVPYGIFLHGTEIWRPLHGLRRRALLGASVLTANSSTTVRCARAVNPWLPEVRVTWLGVPLRQPSARRDTLGGTALIVGRMAANERRKGHDQVLDAWRTIRAAVPHARLLVVGTGDDQPRLARRAVQEKLAGVEFLGWIDDTTRDALYAEASVFLFPSRQEGFGLAAVEAGAQGLAVVGLANTVMEELFPEGQGAVLARAATGAAIAEVTIPLLADQALARAVGEAARARVHASLLEEHFVARFREAVAPWV